MLQLTADAAAFAGAIDLPNWSAAVATAVVYAGLNMESGVNGTVLVPADVTTGVWKEDTRIFIAEPNVVPADGPLDAVYVMTKRHTDNNNHYRLVF